MHTLLIAVLFALVGSVAQADTSSSYDMKNAKQYGNCAVLTLVDMFTDEEMHKFVCLEETLTDETYMEISTATHLPVSSGLKVTLSKGLQVHMEWTIPVAIRIDNGPLIKRNADWLPEGAENAFIYDEQLARQLLHELARSQRVAIQVGNKRGHIKLDGSQRAVADFRQRAGLQAQQTLTPQDRQTLEIPARQF